MFFQIFTDFPPWFLQYFTAIKGTMVSVDHLRRLVDLVDQFAVVLTAMPFVSVGTKAKAIAALKGFNQDDAKKARGSPRCATISGGLMKILMKIGGLNRCKNWISTDVYTNISNSSIYFSYHLDTKSLGNREIFRIVGMARMRKSFSTQQCFHFMGRGSHAYFSSENGMVIRHGQLIRMPLVL